MAVKRIVDSRGRVLYHDGKRFTNAKAYVNDYFAATGRGKRYIFQLDDLSPKEKRIYRAKERYQNSYLYKGKFVTREVARYLEAQKFKKGEVSYDKKIRPKGLRRGLLETIKRESQYFTSGSLIKKGKYYETNRGDELKTAKVLLNAIKRGETVNVIVNGEVFEGKEGVKQLMFWEMEQFNKEGYPVRITHRIHHDRKKGIMEIEVKESEINVLKDS